MSLIKLKKNPLYEVAMLQLIGVLSTQKKLMAEYQESTQLDDDEFRHNQQKLRQLYTLLILNNNISEK